MRLLLASLLCVTALSVRAERIDIGSGAIDLPTGWVSLEDKRDCFVGEIGIKNGFRNADGTVWILSSVFPIESMKRILSDTSQWAVFEKGKASGYDYVVLLKPEHEQFPFIVFPQLRTYFSVMLTEKGFTDPTEALRWWTSPKGEQFTKAFDGVKKDLFSAYLPVDPDTIKQN